MVGIFGRRFGQQSGVASQEIGREIHHGLVAGVVDANLGAGKFAVGKILILEFDLLVGSPEVEVVGSGRVDEQDSRGQDGGREPEGVAAVGLQHRHACQNDREPYCRGQRQPGHGEEREDANQTASQIPGVAIQRARGEFDLAAYGLSDGDENVSQQQEQDGDDQHGQEKAGGVVHDVGPQDLDVLRSAQVLREALHDLGAAPGQTNNDDQSDQSGDGRLPAGPLASQSAAQSEAEKTEQQRQVFHIGKYPDFGGDPADEREFRKQGEGAGQKQHREIPALGLVGGLSARFDQAVADEQQDGKDEAEDAKGHWKSVDVRVEQDNTRVKGLGERWRAVLLTAWTAEGGCPYVTPLLAGELVAG